MSVPPDHPSFAELERVVRVYPGEVVVAVSGAIRRSLAQHVGWKVEDVHCDCAAIAALAALIDRVLGPAQPITVELPDAISPKS